MDEAIPQTTALAVPEKGSAIARIVDDVLNVAANLLADRVNGRKVTHFKRRQKINDHLVMSPTTATSAFIAHVSFGGERKRVGTTIAPMLVDGAPQFDETGQPMMLLVNDYGVVITGKAEIPDPQDPGKRLQRDVQPLVLCDCRGALVPYVRVDESTGQLRAGARMLCLFIRDFDPRTGKENGRVRAIPLGLADSANILRHNEIVRRLATQGSGKAWELIEPIGNNLGRAARFLVVKPPGHPATQGLLPVWHGRDKNECDPQNPNFWCVVRVGGKVATLSRKSQPIILTGVDEPVPEQIFHVDERWNSIELTTWGLPGEIGETDLHELEQEEMRIDWLSLFGASLYSVTPRSGASLLRQALQRPPIDDMVSIGLLPPGGNHEMAVGTLRALAAKARNDIELGVLEAVDRLVNALGVGGLENPGINLEQVLRAPPTSELLAAAHNVAPTQDNLLKVAILASNTAGELGLTVWDPRCWVLQMAYQTLLLQLANQADVQLPPPPVMVEETPAAPTAATTEAPPATAASSDSGSPTNGTSAPAIVWRTDMKRGELYELAKHLEGVTSKATKPTLVAALQAVCQPTPPA